MNILINGVGGPTPRSITKALRFHSSFKDICCIGTDINPHARDLYDNGLYDKSYLVPPAGNPEYWPRMEQIIQTEKIDLALVQPELEVLAWAERAQNAPLPCKALVPDLELARLLVDKSCMTRALAPHGLVPSSYVLDAEAPNFEGLEQKLPYPFWIRSISGSSGLGSLKVKDRQALQTWLAINPGISRFLASAFLPGRNLACKMLYYEGQLVRAACAERVSYIMAKVAPSGITGNTSFGRLLNEPALVKRGIEAMDILFEHTGARKHGFFTIDFKEDAKGEPFITEINIRHVAFSLCFAAARANFAEDTVRLLIDDPAFDRSFHMYEFEEGLIFLRDVDATPLLLNEKNLM